MSNVSSSNLYTLPFQPHPWIQSHPEIKLHDLFIESSFKAQVLDAKLISYPIRAQILAGTLEPPKSAPPPKPFAGTRRELLDRIEETMHKTISVADYNGFHPHLKLLGQLRGGKSLREAQIDSRNELFGSTCVGMAHTILEKLQEYKVKGALAVQRETLGAFEHGAVIVECKDGFVLIDARANPKDRIFSVPFESTIRLPHPGCSITADKSGSTTPLRIQNPKQTFTYHTDVANGDSLVMKHYVMDSLSFFTPIACYNPDGSPHKSIKIYPSNSSAVLIDHTVKGAKKAETISFKAIRNGELLPKLESFMTLTVSAPLIPRSFHTPTESVYNQIVSFALQEKQISQCFTEVD